MQGLPGGYVERRHAHAFENEGVRNMIRYTEWKYGYFQRLTRILIGQMAFASADKRCSYPKGNSSLCFETMLPSL